MFSSWYNIPPMKSIAFYYWYCAILAANLKCKEIGFYSLFPISKVNKSEKELTQLSISSLGCSQVQPSLCFILERVLIGITKFGKLSDILFPTRILSSSLLYHGPLNTSPITEHRFKCLRSAGVSTGCWGLRGDGCLVNKTDNSGKGEKSWARGSRLGVDLSDRLLKGSDVEGETWLMSRSFPKFSFSLSFQVTGKAVAENIRFHVSSATMVYVKKCFSSS